MPPDHMTSPPMRFENGLETQPPLPAHTLCCRSDMVNSDPYYTDLKLVCRLNSGSSTKTETITSFKNAICDQKIVHFHVNVSCAIYEMFSMRYILEKDICFFVLEPEGNECI